MSKGSGADSASSQRNGGFNYYVSDDQLKVFSSCSAAERLRWLEETREVLWKLAPGKTKQSWRRLGRK